MARSINKFSARSATTMSIPGVHGDGNGLYLRVTPEGTRSWVFRYMINGRARSMGLGAHADVSLAEVRETASDLRRQVRRGRDPIDERKEEKERVRSEQRASTTFRECAESYVASHKAGWRNEKHAAQWTSTLTTYVYPVFGEAAVQAVDRSAVMKVLDPIWGEKSETASRLRGRIESILGWATVQGLRSGDNPARWKGHLDKLLPARSRVRQVKHHSALPYGEAAAFMTIVRSQHSTSALALEFAILTAARTGEVVGAEWTEIDLDRRLWTVPGSRMKAGKPHRVALSEGAIAVLKKMEFVKSNAYVFSAVKKDSHLSNMALLKLLQRMGRTDITVHGFRSAFSDWAAECTEFPNEVVEMALAHTISNRVEAAYRRGDMFERRQKLMETWARYCDEPIEKSTGAVVAIQYGEVDLVAG
jgi:integrase